MSGSLRAQIDRYVDGTASAAERRAVERALVDDAEAMRLLGEALLLRALLQHAPPEVPPEEVVARWEAAVLGELQGAAEGDSGWFGQALDSLGWSVRGPALSVSTAGAAPVWRGVQTLRYGLGSAPPPKRSIWRRALDWGLRR